MAKKKFYIVLDTETCGDYVFDIGYRIIDKKGKCYAAGSYVMQEFMTDPDALEMFTNRFTSRKIAKYYFALWQNDGKFTVAPFEQIRTIINAAIQEYNAIVCAYNISFDLAHLTKTAEYFGYDSFFDDATIEILDIWNVAMCILGTKKFIRFCMTNKFYTAKGYIQTSAEIMYRYIINDATFEEAHTAHEDCIIECAILTKCFKQKKHFETKKVNPCICNKAWKEIQALHKELK